jgi:ribonuclease T2
MRLGLISVLAACLLTALPAVAVPLDGTFVAASACPAWQSFRDETNPGNVRLQPGRSYDIVEANRVDAPTHYRVEIAGASPPQRWVEAGCGGVAGGTEADSGGEPGWFVLAASWQPGFCETRDGEGKPECETQTASRFDAGHFALHGLWPQPRDNRHCGVRPQVIALDRAPTWDELPEVRLSPGLRAELDRAMPGTASSLDRHEWIAHGTCYGADQEGYFADSLGLLDDLNASSLNEFFVANLGRNLRLEDIRAAIDQALGPGAALRTGIVCEVEERGGRRVLTELRIQIEGVPGEDSLAKMIAATRERGEDDCFGGRAVIDAAGYR